ncbi:MAG: plasmid mobilization protein, partial [Eubacterium sp.]
MVIAVSKETKSERINLHLTPTGKSIIKEKADLVGMNMTNYLTACAIVEKIY